MAIDPQTAYKSYFAPQGIGADLIATLHGFSREDVDAYAVASQHRAAEAWAKGYFNGSVLPIRNHVGDVVLDHDETVRADASMESLAGLNPAFAMMGDQAGFDDVAILKYPQVEAINHVHTAGNSSGIVDGAAAVVVTTAELAAAEKLDVFARIVAWGIVGCDPKEMGWGPVPAIRACLERARVALDDVERVEINEAFAAQYVACEKELGLDRERCNVNGGAISLGHPLGATGTRLVLTLMYELRRAGKRYGIASACIGGGQGIALLIENPDKAAMRSQS